MSNKRKHNTLTLKDKLETLKRLDNGESVTKLAKELNVGKATICDWKKNRAKLQQYCTTSSEVTLENRQTARQSQYDKVDEALFLWFSQERERGTPLSGPIVQEKAIQLNNLLNGDSSFTASTGWFDRWKKRHGIRQLTVTGEQLSSDQAAAQEYLASFDNLISEGNYSPQQIYNADETGLNFRALPTKSLASKSESRAPGFKMCKDRVTIMACSNAAGNHKLPLMMIGKAAKPRAFKHINMKSLPVYYRNQKRGWMDGKLFKEWFHDQFVPSVKRFSQENDIPPRAILLLDNAPSHPDVDELTCGEIKAAFLPPNVTPLLQPMDQGVLQALKLKYRKHFLKSLIEDDTIPLVQKIKQTNVKDVVYWAAESWENVTTGAIRKSWKKLWKSLDFEETPTENDPVNLLPMIRNIPGCENAEEEDVDEWMAADGTSAETQTDDDIVAAVTQDHVQGDEGEGSDDEPGGGGGEEKVTHNEAAAALDLALRCC
ncbi:jerky protein homolog-like [Macrosteles quadrilineatus]|uniref:jerky protein homolog-like n=1 Tax=Macrosteles quadrilineatus TaxID=74068 RepID=UPI0023E1395E|nr:jerky protein homolog-like [Macrosteles quadrilineatus]